MIKIIYLISLFFNIFSNAQDCLLEVPNDPLNTGLFKPWYVSTNSNSLLPCSQTIPDSAVFVEATILDIDNGKLYVYYPLVVDNGKSIDIPIITSVLPINNIVTIYIGANSDSVTLLSSAYSSVSLDQGNCVNGIKNSIFGQVAYCNAVNFYEKVNLLIKQGLIIVPPLKNSFLGDICPTVRSFSVIDQDQSDNVLSSYILTTDMKVAQDYTIYKNKLNILKLVKNGSDNALLSNFIYKAIGCEPFMAPDLADLTILRSSSALNEIQANLNDTTNLDIAIVPSINPMCLVNGEENLEKTNAYRQGYNQPLLIQLNQQDNINYCNSLYQIAVQFFILHINELKDFVSPDESGNNLLNFLCNRFVNSWNNLNCEKIINLPSPINVTLNSNGTTVSNNLDTIIQKKTINLCGTSYYLLNCSSPCPSGLDIECDYLNGYKCFASENNYCNIINNYSYTNNNNSLYIHSSNAISINCKNNLNIFIILFYLFTSFN